MSEVGMSYNAGFSPGGAELQGGLPPPPAPEVSPPPDSQPAPVLATETQPTESGTDMADPTKLAVEGIGANTGGKEINAQRAEQFDKRLNAPAEGEKMEKALKNDDKAVNNYVDKPGQALTTAGGITTMVSPLCGPAAPVVFIVGAIVAAVGAILKGISAAIGGKGAQRMAQLKQGAQTRDAGEKAVAEAAKSDRSSEITILADANAQALQGSQDTQGTQVETSSAAQMTMESSAAA